MMKQPSKNYRRKRSFYENAATWLVCCFIFTWFLSCIDIAQQYSGLAPGIWRGIIKLDDVARIENSDLEIWNLSSASEVGDLPFNFQVSYSSKDSFYLELLNGAKKLRVDRIFLAKDGSTGNDTLFIRFPGSGAYLRAIAKENMIEGRWHLPGERLSSLPFIAYHGQSHRFQTIRDVPPQDLSGNWMTNFQLGQDEAINGTVMFSSIEKILTAKIDGPALSLEHLAGSYHDNRFQLSYFDGSNAALLEGRIEPDGSLIGTFRKGPTYRMIWTAHKSTE